MPFYCNDLAVGTYDKEKPACIPNSLNMKTTIRSYEALKFETSEIFSHFAENAKLTETLFSI